MSHKTRSIHAEAGLHRKLILFAAQLETYLAHFPACHKYTLTAAIRQAFVDVYNLVTEAQKRYHKRTTLTQLDVRHEQLRMLLVLAYELGLFNFSRGKQDPEAPGEHRPLIQYLQEHHHALFDRLPQSHRLHHHSHAAPAGG